MVVNESKKSQKYLYDNDGFNADENYSEEITPQKSIINAEHNPDLVQIMSPKSKRISTRFLVACLLVVLIIMVVTVLAVMLIRKENTTETESHSTEYNVITTSTSKFTISQTSVFPTISTSLSTTTFEQPEITFEPEANPPIISRNCVPSGHVSSCSDFSCTNIGGESQCTQVLQTEVVTTTCSGESLEMISETLCGCIPCNDQKFHVTITGNVHDVVGDTSLIYGSIYMNGEELGITDYHGNFDVTIERYTSGDVTLTFIDELNGIFLPTSKNIVVNNDLSTLTTDVVMIEKDNTLDTTQDVTTIDFSDTETPLWLNIPPNSFNFQNGSSYHGSLTIDYTFMDTTSSDDLEQTTKSFLTNDGKDRLETYGMFKVHARTPNEDTLTIEKSTVNIPISVINDGHSDKLKLWSFNEWSGEWEFEASFIESRKSKMDAREEIILVAIITIHGTTLYNVASQADHPYCFVKVRAFTDEIQTNELHGVTVNAVYQGTSDEWISYTAMTTSSDKGTCMQVPCNDKGAVKKIYFTATNLNNNLLALTKDDLLQSTSMTSDTLDSFEYEINGGNSFSLAMKHNIVNDEEGPIYSEGLCNEVTLSENQQYFGFYSPSVETPYVPMNAVYMNEAAIPDPNAMPQCLSWWPNHEMYVACYIKVKIEGTTSTVTFQTNSKGGTLKSIKYEWIGTRYAESAIDGNGENYACIEYKCADNISPTTSSNGCNVPYNFVNPSSGEVDRTLVRVEPVGTSCTIQSINSNLINDLTNDMHGDDYIENMNGEKSFYFYDPRGISSYGIYSFDDSNPIKAKAETLAKCSGNRIAEAVTFYCT